MLVEAQLINGQPIKSLGGTCSLWRHCKRQDTRRKQLVFTVRLDDTDAGINPPIRVSHTFASWNNMPLFENPANFSKSRLKAGLVAHNVSLPPAKSKKEVYVGLYLKHVGQKSASDFYRGGEDRVQDMPVSGAAV